MITGDEIRKELSGQHELSAQDIQDMLDEYPYFQTARLLYLEKTKDTPLYKQALSKGAIYTPDRKILFALTEADRHRWTALQEKTDVEKTADSSFSLIDKFLEMQPGCPAERQTKEEEILERTLLNPTGVSEDYFLTPMAGEEPEAETPGQMSLIDSFIEKVENNRVDLSLRDTEPDRPAAVPDSPEEESLTKSGDEAFLTESLAKIYIKQKRYSKALEIIKKLSLKYPEKNIYFADQIRFLEKLIINIKTV